jgi:hypothetical protein
VTPFSGLGPLCHLDLDLLRADQVPAGHTETPARHLLDGRAAVIFGSGRQNPLLTLSAFSAVRSSVQSVHRDRKRLVCFFRYGTVRHGSRLEPSYYALCALDLGYIKATKDSRQLTGCPLQAQWGLAYLFNTEKKVSPLIRGGITFNHLLGASGKGMEGVSGDNKKFQDMDFGFYVGAGADIALGKHTLRLSINYDYSSSIGLFNAMDNESLKTSAIDIRAGILF